MLLDFEELIKKYNLKIRGVIHIGAHYGQEHQIYKNENISNIVYFEPLLKNFQVLKENVKDEAILFNLALGCEKNEIEMFVENNNLGQSSSILEPHLHLQQYPIIQFDKKELVKMEKLDDIDITFEHYNLINIDVQGYELNVFCGAKKVLEKIDYIISEVNRADLYKNCTKVEELDLFLKTYGFERVETSWVGNTWGDALYIKKNDTL
jgi:FkbM family methyltransferase